MGVVCCYVISDMRVQIETGNCHSYWPQVSCSFLIKSITLLDNSYVHDMNKGIMIIYIDFL